MSVKLRLRRMGKKKQPFYRVVATDSRVARDGKYIENIANTAQSNRILSIIPQYEFHCSSYMSVPKVASFFCGKIGGTTDKILYVGAKIH